MTLQGTLNNIYGPAQAEALILECAAEYEGELDPLLKITAETLIMDTPRRQHLKLKAWYLSLPRTEQQWQAVTQNVSQFNWLLKRWLNCPTETDGKTGFEPAPTAEWLKLTSPAAGYAVEKRRGKTFYLPTV